VAKCILCKAETNLYVGGHPICRECADARDKRRGSTASQSLDNESFLRKDLARAQAVYEQTQREFRAIISDVPSGIPQPDGSLRIENASRKNAAALDDYVRALREFSAFLSSGTSGRTTHVHRNPDRLDPNRQ